MLTETFRSVRWIFTPARSSARWLPRSKWRRTWLSAALLVLVAFPLACAAFVPYKLACWLMMACDEASVRVVRFHGRCYNLDVKRSGLRPVERRAQLQAVRSGIGDPSNERRVRDGMG